MDNSRYTTIEAGTVVPAKRVTWGAIFAGALVMLVTMLLLSLLGLGVGLGSINPASESQPMSGIGTGAIIWWVVSNLIAVFAGGYVAGKLTNSPVKGGGLIHGLVTWSLYTVVSFFILSTAVGAIFSGVGSVLTKSFSSIGSGVGSLVKGAQGNNFDLQAILNKTTGKNVDLPNSDQMMSVLKDVFFKDGKLSTDIQQKDIENAVAQNTQLSRDQVKQVSAEVHQAYQQTLAQWDDVKVNIEEANEAASKAAIWSFVALIIGAVVAAVGGMIGGKKEEEVVVPVPPTYREEKKRERVTADY